MLATPGFWPYASWRPVILLCGNGCSSSKINFDRPRRPRAPPCGPTPRTSAVGSASHTDMRRPAVRELAIGAGLLSRGMGLIIRRPGLFLLGAIPPAITSVIFTGLLIALITQLEPAVDWLTPFADGWARGLATTIRVIVGTTLVAGSVLLMVISFTVLTLALGSPLYDKLSESVEREFGEVPELNENVARGLLRALRQAVTLIAVSLVGALALLATGFVPVVGRPWCRCSRQPLAAGCWGLS